MSTTTDTTGMTCGHCGETDVRLDQNDYCEQCVMNLGRIAGDPLTGMEEVVKEWLVRGLPPAQLREAFEMSLSDAEGPLLGTCFTREPVETSERAVWNTPPSAFTPEGVNRRRQHIEHLRRCSGLSLETLADHLGVMPSELALWEADVIPPRSCALAMADLFGTSLAGLLGVFNVTHCARCHRRAPRRGRKPEAEGWDVAGGTEFVCGGCLVPGDLDWPSDAS